MADGACVFIHAAVALGPGGATGAVPRVALERDPDTDLRALTKTVLGQPLRQASHFVELIAIGAQLCLSRLGAVVAPDTAVYFGTGLGEVRKTESLFAQVMRPGPGIASPFDFINASSNMGTFYVARHAGLMTRNLTVTQGIFSFESALSLALDDIRAGDVAQALVGGADENSFPRSDHRRRLPLRDDQIMGEGSGWFCLSSEWNGAIGEAIDVVPLVTAGYDTPAWAREVGRAVTSHTHGGVTILPGYGVTAEEERALADRLPSAQFKSYLEYCGCFPAAAAFGLAALFDKPVTTGGVVVHVNRDNTGGTMLVVVRLLPSVRE
jgi:hypothetical protein